MDALNAGMDALVEFKKELQSNPDTFDEEDIKKVNVSLSLQKERLLEYRAIEAAKKARKAACEEIINPMRKILRKRVSIVNNSKCAEMAFALDRELMEYFIDKQNRLETRVDVSSARLIHSYE